VSLIKDNKKPFVIAIDGPAGSGKGTIAKLISEKLSFHYLDSGAVYRVIAYAALLKNISPEDESNLSQISKINAIEFVKDKTLLNKEDITNKIRTDEISIFASKIAIHSSLRASILNFQKSFFKHPGLVAEGRDMTSVVFPEAKIKIFLNASVQERANRRFKQLILKEKDVNLAEVTEQIMLRDSRDRDRLISPLIISENAYILETDKLSIQQTVDKILQFIMNNLGSE